MISKIIPCGNGPLIYPKRKTKSSIGYDVYANSDFVIEPNKIIKHKAGFKLILDSSQDGTNCHYVKIMGRSGLLSKGIIVLEGLVDTDYREEIQIMMYNCTNESYSFAKGDRIAQMILHNYDLKNNCFFDEHNNELKSENVDRSSGFGSTGK